MAASSTHTCARMYAPLVQFLFLPRVLSIRPRISWMFIPSTHATTHLCRNPATVQYVIAKSEQGEYGVDSPYVDGTFSDDVTGGWWADTPAHMSHACTWL